MSIAEYYQHRFDLDLHFIIDHWKFYAGLGIFIFFMILKNIFWDEDI